MVRLSLGQKRMDARIAPLLLGGPGTMSSAPRGEAPIIDLGDIGKRNTGCLCLCRQTLGLGKAAGKARSVCRLFCLNTLVCRKGPIRSRVLV